MSTASGWYKKEPLAALRWAEALPDETQRDNALRAMNGTWNDIPDRPAHADLLAQLSDKRVRETMLGAHLREWIRSDLPAARHWLETHDALRPEDAARLLAEAGGSR